jgi:hypothetical protein
MVGRTDLSQRRVTTLVMTEHLDLEQLHDINVASEGQLSRWPVWKEPWHCGSHRHSSETCRGTCGLALRI